MQAYALKKMQVHGVKYGPGDRIVPGVVWGGRNAHLLVKNGSLMFVPDGYTIERARRGWAVVPALIEGDGATVKPIDKPEAEAISESVASSLVHSKGLAASSPPEPTPPKAPPKKVGLFGGKGKGKSKSKGKIKGPKNRAG